MTDMSEYFLDREAYICAKNETTGFSSMENVLKKLPWKRQRSMDNQERILRFKQGFKMLWYIYFYSG